MRTATRIGLIIFTGAALTLGGCTTTAPDHGGQSSAACAAPELDLTPDAPTPGQTLTITGTGWGPCNDTNEENSSPPWQSVAIELIQNGDATSLGTLDVTNGRISGSVVVSRDAKPGDASLRIVTPDPLYVQDFPVTVGGR